MNDRGDIAGAGVVAGKPHGFLLSVDSIIRDKDKAIGLILWGVINDAAGVQFIGGRFRRVPPYGPLKDLLNELPTALQQEIVSAIDQARFDDRNGVAALSFQVRAIVERYRLQSLSSSESSPP